VSTTTALLAPEARRHFERALELDDDARRLYLAQACDAALARRIEELVSAERAAPGFLERPAQESELVGRRAGPWIVEQRLSSGGMSEVYRARRADGEHRWAVALKVLKRRADGAALARRFASERRTLAALSHPYIVALVDAGTLEDGRPYLATELVEGAPIDAAAAPLAFEARLALFLSVCAGVQHAHERLIVHCDLKPDNVLVRPDGMPQLLDFGIARLLSEDDGGLQPFTPGYASPEQIAGRPLTTASDVWSLGVLLYELVTGRRAEPGLAPSVALRTRPAVRPCAPREPVLRLARRLSGDFDAVVGHALATDPEHRYGSVATLAADVERFLELWPVSARALGPLARAALFLRRNRVLVAAGALALAGLGAGLVGLYRELERNRAEASLGWRAHAQAVVAGQMVEELVRGAHAAPADFERALDEAAGRLEGTPDLGPETEGRLRLALGALYLEVGRGADAERHLVRAQELATVQRGFGREDRERIAALLARAQSQPARSTNQ